jgi:hypothetical protein
MAVGNWQKFFRGSLQPLLTGCRLALGAMSIAAGVKLDGLVKATIALMEASTESSGATGADVPEDLALLGRKPMPPTGKELLSVLTKDIGHFQPM